MTRITGPCAVHPDADVDTDQICPARFLHTPRAEGYAPMLFHDLRAAHHAKGRVFALDREGAEGAAVLIAGRNFGCGSSREQAVWALKDAGFQAILAPSFGDIFRNNCASNSLLAIIVEEHVLSEMADVLEDYPRSLEILVEAGVLRMPDRRVDFTLDPLVLRRLGGTNDIDETFEHKARIAAFAADRLERHPWLLIHERQGHRR